MRIALLRLLLIALLGAAASAGAEARCPEGQRVTLDTAGHCCWPGQAWSNARRTCVGIPQCGAGFEPSGESCQLAGCAVGQVRNEDTAGQCCWPGQAWSSRKAACVGIPSCPPGLSTSGERCLSPGAASAHAAVPSNEPRPPPSDGVADVEQTPPSAAEGVPADVLVQFEPVVAGSTYFVTVQGPNGPMQCKTPCSLRLPPGPTQLSVRGDGEFEREVDIPKVAAITRLQHIERAPIIGGSAAMMMLGGVIAWVTVGELGRGSALSLLTGSLSMLCLGMGTAGIVLAFVRKPVVEVTPVEGLGWAPTPGNDRRIRLEGFAAAPLPEGGLVAAAAFRF